tara:strand:- start:22 stop:198 length:177 start_codon:yes stop_codon:yes gene_type:complete
MENKGDRIRLIHTDDPYTKLKTGDQGTIRRVTEDMISVDWDTGSSLSLIYGEDEWETL